MNCEYSTRGRGHLPSKSTKKSVIIGAISLIVALHGTTAAAFLQPSTSIPHIPEKYGSRHSGSMSTRTASPRTSLSMVAKSGGRPIITTEQFEREVLLSGNDDPDGDKEVLPVLVLFSAPWCGPCRLTNPVVKEVMKQYQAKIEVAEISTDDLPDVASDAGVQSIPTILIYHKGEVMDTIVGCVAKNVLARAVDKVLEDLGMLDDDED